MTTLLDRDWAARMAARFGGRLAIVTFSRTSDGSLDPDNPTGPPITTTTNYKADGIALGYDVVYVESEQLWRGDYSVMMLVGTTVQVADDLTETPAPSARPKIGDVLSIAPPGLSTPQRATVTELSAVTAAFVTAAVRGPAP